MGCEYSLDQQQDWPQLIPGASELPSLTCPPPLPALPPCPWKALVHL